MNNNLKNNQYTHCSHTSAGVRDAESDAERMNCEARRNCLPAHSCALRIRSESVARCGTVSITNTCSAIA